MTRGAFEQVVLTPSPGARAPTVHITGWPAALIILAVLGAVAAFIWRFVYHRRRADAIARRAQMQYRALFESSPAGMFLYDTRTQKIIAGNPAFCEIVGYSAAEITTLSLSDIFPEDVVDEARRDYGSGKLMPAQPGPIITKVRRRDGSEVDVDARGRPMDPVLGHARVVMVLDVSEQLLAERGLREAELRARSAGDLLTSIIDVAPQAIIALDLELNVTLWNRAAESLFGWTSEEVLGRQLPFVTPEERDTITAGFEVVKRDGSVKAYDTIRLHKDGSRISLIGSAGLRVDTSGAPAGYVVVYTDVRQYRQLEMQLRQSQKMEAVGRLAGGVAHDFNNMLTVISAYVQLLKSEHMDDEMTAPLTEIESATARAASLTRQLLTFGRRQVVNVTSLNINDLVEKLQPMLQRLSPDNIAVQTTLSSTLGDVRADAAQLEQVIVNLAMNALDAMDGKFDGGLLRFETSNVELDPAYALSHQDVIPGPFVMLAVTDNGTGMDATTAAKIFEPFFTTKPSGRGTGLGLAIAYSVIRQANGHIAVDSELGRGTTVRIYLPRNATPAVRIPDGAKVYTASRGGTVLLVEDDDAVRRSVRATLARLGYDVLEAANGASALVLLRNLTTPIVAVLTDLMMPGMSGRELSEHIRVLHPAIRVVFMSGYTDDEVVRRRLVDEGQQFLQKPFTSEQLVVAIEPQVESAR